MDKNPDIRWKQRFSNYKKAFEQLSRFVQKENLNEMEKQGLIQSFEYTFELAWKTLQDILENAGYNDVRGPRPVLIQAFRDGYITEGETWMEMLKDRNRSSHTYNEEIAQEIARTVKYTYHPLFEKLKTRLETVELN